MTVDPELVEAGSQAVAAGRAGSLSAWVNDALAMQVARDRRLDALSVAIADYEAAHGEITAEEMAAQEQCDRAGAVVVGKPTTSTSSTRASHERPGGATP